MFCGRDRRGAFRQQHGSRRQLHCGFAHQDHQSSARARRHGYGAGVCSLLQLVLPDSAAAKYTYVGRPPLWTEPHVGLWAAAIRWLSLSHSSGSRLLTSASTPAVSFTVDSLPDHGPLLRLTLPRRERAGSAAGGTSANTAADDYLYVSGLAIISLQLRPRTCDWRHRVINGDGFVGVTEVRFGSVVVPAANYTVDSAGKITVKSACRPARARCGCRSLPAPVLPRQHRGSVYLCGGAHHLRPQPQSGSAGRRQ